MSARDRQRYTTTAVVFVLAFGLICALFIHSAMTASAQAYTFFLRPSGGVSEQYEGDCANPGLITATQNWGDAYDTNVITAAVTYSDADFSPQTSLDTDFSLSGLWAGFLREETEGLIDTSQFLFCVKSLYLYVVRDAFNNTTLDSLRQWKIEYSFAPEALPSYGRRSGGQSFWNEMARFKIWYTAISGNLLAHHDKIINIYKAYEEGFIKQRDITIPAPPAPEQGELVVERYYPAEFASWEIGDQINSVDGSFRAAINKFSIEHNPPKETLGGVWLADNPDEDYVRNYLAVRTRTRQRHGCIDKCPLCETSPDDGVYPLARVNIYDIYLEGEWCFLHDPLYIYWPEEMELPTANCYDRDGHTITIKATGGYTPYDWGEGPIDGELPEGFTYEFQTESPYDLIIYYPPYDPNDPPPEDEVADAGVYEFTVQVSDDTAFNYPDYPNQTYEKTYILPVECLQISPCPPPAVKGEDFDPPPPAPGEPGWWFRPLGLGPPYYWCWTGDLPPGMSLTKSLGGDVPVCPDGGDPEMTFDYLENDHLVFSGTPTNDGVYVFTIKLKDTYYDEPVELTCEFEVRAAGVTLQPKKLKGYIKDVPYGTAADEMRPEFIMATGIDNAGAIDDVYNVGEPGDIYIIEDPSADPPYPPDVVNLPVPPLDPVFPLKLSPAGEDSLPADIPFQLPLDDESTDHGVFRINIVGRVPIETVAKNYAFTAGIYDPYNVVAETDLTEYVLPVLERRTVILKAPPSAVALPADCKLDFLVFGEGGAPSEQNGTEVDVNRTPYYNYRWAVAPVPNTNSPELGISGGGPTSPNSAKPYIMTITFKDDKTPPGPAIGTYDVTFWAQDVLRRQNMGDSDYKFKPATVRLKVMKTLDKDAQRPVKLRQEMFE